MMDTSINFLEKKARWVRKQIVEMIFNAKKGHIGGALSCTDILVSLFYGDILRYDARDPGWPDRDRFIMSKGHSGVALYTILADLGFFPLSELSTFCGNATMLGGHPDRNIPGVETDSGSLGQGLGIGAGLSLCAKLDHKDYKTVVLVGDGECYEGSLWEAAMFAGHHELGNLAVVIDRNGQCVTDFTEDCVRLEPFAEKWEAFGWEVKSIDGHSHKEILEVLKTIKARDNGKPLAVIASTIKGRGVSFMERQLHWHHGVPTSDELETARKELDIDLCATPVKEVTS
ncbi:MAG: transketolase [Syntrophorhabdaceae bacterium]|nr:transketolase [Syntrophorhabdaceae bacterium]